MKGDVLGVCSRGHRLTHVEDTEHCYVGHEHHTLVCRLRLGARPHGERTVEPPYTRACFGPPQR